MKDIPPKDELARQMWELRHCEEGACEWTAPYCDCRDHAQSAAARFYRWLESPTTNLLRK